MDHLKAAGGGEGEKKKSREVRSSAHMAPDSKFPVHHSRLRENPSNFIPLIRERQQPHSVRSLLRSVCSHGADGADSREHRDTGKAISLSPSIPARRQGHPRPIPAGRCSPWDGDRPPESRPRCINNTCDTRSRSPAGDSGKLQRDAPGTHRHRVLAVPEHGPRRHGSRPESQPGPSHLAEPRRGLRSPAAPSPGFPRSGNSRQGKPPAAANKTRLFLSLSPRQTQLRPLPPRGSPIP